jgi:hypothetical protein
VPSCDGILLGTIRGCSVSHRSRSRLREATRCATLDATQRGMWYNPSQNLLKAKELKLGRVPLLLAGNSTKAGGTLPVHCLSSPTTSLSLPHLDVFFSVLLLLQYSRLERVACRDCARQGQVAAPGTRRECHRSQGLGIHRETLNRTPLLLPRSDGRLFTQTQG